MDDTATNIFMEIKEQLGALNANMQTVLARLTNHESRLTTLETRKDGDWKTQLLMLLAKAIVIGAVSIGSLVGASGIIQSVFKIG